MSETAQKANVDKQETERCEVESAVSPDTSIRRIVREEMVKATAASQKRSACIGR